MGTNGGGVEVTLSRAAEMYGIPARMIFDWRRTRRLNEFNGLVIHGERFRINTSVIEAKLGLHKVKKR